MCSIYCLFLFICLLIFGDLTKLILPLSVCVALWDFYYMYLFFQDMEDDFNRLVDFLIHFWVSFQNFINALQMLLNNLPWRQLIRFNGIIIWNSIVSSFIRFKHVMICLNKDTINSTQHVNTHQPTFLLKV